MALVKLPSRIAPMSEEYYKLKPGDHWLRDGDSPLTIGGRNTEIDQIYLSLEKTIKSMYPINGVPEHIAEQLRVLGSLCMATTEKIQTVIDEVSKDVAGESQGLE